ncbi:MAG: histidine kinase [Bacteroidia bacterium]
MKNFKTLLVFFPVFVSVYATAQIPTDTLWRDIQKMHLTKTDSAIKLVYQRLNTIVKPADYDNLSQAHHWIGTTFMKINMDSATAHAATALQYAAKAAKPILFAKAHHLQGSIDNRMSKFDNAVASFDKGLKALELEKDTAHKRYKEIYELLLRGMSTSYNYMDKNNEALNYGLKALTFAQKNKLDFPEMAGLIAISSLHFKINDVKEAKKYMHQALAKSIVLNNKLAGSKCYANLAIYHNTENNFDSAYYYQSKAIELNREIENHEGLISNLVILSAIESDRGKIKEAIALLEEADKIAKEMNFDLQRFDILINFCYAFNKEKRYKEALEKADELILLSEKKKRFDKIVKVYKEKYKALSGLGKYKEATEWLEKSIAISDSLKKEENEKNLQQLLVKYETEKKEEEIKRMTTEAQVKDLLIRQRNIQLISVVIGVVVLLGLALLLFRNYKIKKEFELLDLKQRFYRAQINPHFLFNALGSVQGFFYDKTDPNKAAGYLSRLSKLMRQILENTFDNQVSLAEEKTLMENYLEIQKVRMGNRFDYEIEMDDDLRDVLIPSMITQPFLENAVEHGFKELSDRKGKINILISEVDNALQIKIQDNGTGLSEKKEPSEHKSRAMDITWERLKLLGKTKKKNANFEVIDNAANGGVGVTVLINLPI